MRPFSLYVHVPYCLQKCPYCDFNTYALASFPERDYVSAMLADLDYRAAQPDFCGRPIQSIYFGGGTPSLFSPRSIRKIIGEACALFPITERIEVSLEANPGTVDSDKLAGYEECGVNRLSFGAQSMQPETLKALGRMHSPDDIANAISLARTAGLENINLDLMYGAPHQTLVQLREDIRAFLDLAVPHVSAYGLTIEKGTPFFTSFKKGILSIPPEDTVAEMMEEVNRAFPEWGLPHYEISNFAKPGFEARHNLAYWNGDDYLGLGAGAHSCVTKWSGLRKISARRWSNYALPNRYTKHASSEGRAEGWSDELSTQDLMFEYFFLGLRKIQGVSTVQFEEHFGCTIESMYPTLLEILAAEGLLTVEHGNLRLTNRGIMVADSVIEHFSAPEGVVQQPPSESRPASVALEA